MSKKTQEIKQIKQNYSKKRIIRVSLKFASFFIIAFTIYLIYQLFASPEAKINNTCITNETQAKQSIKLLPDVSKYFTNLKNSVDSPYINIDVQFGNTDETKIGYAFVGQKTENNSILIKYKYLFLTGCSAKFQKMTDVETKFVPIKFDYDNQMATITYSDQTTQCNSTMSKMNKIDIDRDGQPEFLYGCYKGGLTNSVDYYLYKNKIGKIYLLDSFKSSGNFEEVTDFNKDGYPDIATAGILMDENQCNDAQCFAPYKKNQIKILIKRSYHRYWDPTTNKFAPPIKAETYYFKDSKRIIVTP